MSWKFKQQAASAGVLHCSRRAATLGLIAWPLGGCNQGVVTYRFRLVVEVIDDGELKSGSSVIEVSTWVSGGWGFSEVGGTRSSARGETAFVDLGPKGCLVPLFVFPFPGSGFLERLALLAFRKKYPEITAKQLSKMQGEADLQAELQPYLASFSNPLDPGTVQLVPGANVGAIFGQNMRLKRIYIELTSEAPAGGLLKERMPWVVDHKTSVEVAKKLAVQGLDFGGISGTSYMFMRGN
ncbi:hypothetical protein IED13_23120 [Bosea sp. SSUT16]|jgi:hypothetical protein|uniref:Uncharacterized protein n=1 Tax=Bosea spartocytisi TaxID=2773451 RepID=A0A927EC55_9HYPH|nr:hypothetical protein [Bosea spartocytisi]MBD3848598.1 hypothetical protein [Bosea spartocytisi]MCT4475046.1 hypothetical protein [Bosea spartocytisi]